MSEKVLMNKQGKKFLIRDTNQDLHTQYGFFKKDDLKKAKSDSRILSNTKKQFTIFDPYFIDLYKKIKRSAQIIPLKDIGLIIAETGVNSKSKIVDAGSGSGALACFLANFVKEVITYEIRDDFIKIVKDNINFLNLKNVKIKKKDIYDKIVEKDVDLIILDLPETWKALKNTEKALKPGAFLVTYSPTIPQVMDFVDKVRGNKNFAYIKTSEMIERTWEIEARKVRPRSQAIGHSGFISFVRRI